MKSLRGRLTAGLLAGTTLLAGTSGVASYLWSKARLQFAFDQNLTERVVALAALVEDEAGKLQIDWLEAENDPLAHLEGIDYFAIWMKESGQIVAVSTNLSPASIPRFGGTLSQPETRDTILPGNRPGRCAGVEFTARRALHDDDFDHDDPSSSQNPVSDDAALAPPPILQLVIAKTDTVGPALAAIKWPLAGAWSMGILAGGLFIWLAIGQGLRPLEQLKAQINSLQDDVSARRISLDQPPSELDPVTRELNHLLDRVEQALLRERTLTSNVAHELRTPLAGLLSTLEVTLNRPRSAAEYRESTLECCEITKRLHWLVDNLLSITRLEAGAVRLQMRPVELETALREWWKPFEPRAAERTLQTEWQIDPLITLQTDSEFLRVVVTNLFDNAVSYTPAGGKIRIEARAPGSISVANQSIDLTPAAVERVFDPFWRNSEAREESGPHAGLGLSLSKKIIELLGGRISARLAAEKVFVVNLEMA